ncbi:MAG: right-handed parallel beta-helix repeat-containing protein [Sandaracinaceae bacterium]|nr:right-handed parallel beta-helix repeat-containing protein [Sandaracinaceae bacterium]
MFLRRVTVGLAAGVLIASCGGDDGAVEFPSDCTARLSPTADDQTAVLTAFNEATDGAKICFGPGNYSFNGQLDLATTNVTLFGVGMPVLDFADQTSGANGISVVGNGFEMDGMWIKNSHGDGIRVTGATGVTFRNVKVSWDGEPSMDNGAYALYPVSCTNVLIEDCEIEGASDAGLYVGQSHNIIVRRNVVHGNVAGIEIENSTNADVYENEAYDNTAGILVFDLPQLPVHNGGMTRVHNNSMHDNNRPNFAHAGTIVAGAPSGLGLMTIAGNDIEIDHNTIEGNQNSAVLLVSYTTVEEAGLAGSRITDPDFDPYLEGVFIHDNTFNNNGYEPIGTLGFLVSGVAHPDVEEFPPLEDILFDGWAKPDFTGHQLCIQDSTATFRDFDGQHIFTDMAGVVMSTDKAPYDCTLPNQAPVVLPQE